MDAIKLSGSELLFYFGLTVMAIALISTVVCAVAFIFAGRKLKEKLTREYGEPLA